MKELTNQYSEIWGLRFEGGEERTFNLLPQIADMERMLDYLEHALIMYEHLPECPQATGPYDLGELEPVCNCGHDALDREGAYGSRRNCDDRA